MRLRTSELAAAAGLLVLALASLAATLDARPPAPLPADAPAETFSAGRATRLVERIAAENHPLGTAAHAAVRETVVAELAALGLEPEVQEALVLRAFSPGRIRAVRVRNVVARRRGTDTTGVVLLASHYDSRAQTPGAGDASAGVAAIVESLRALAAGSPPRNDLAVLVSDGEELGLTGARAFVDEHPLAAEVKVALNLEARGNRGPAPMFETGAGSLELVRLLARSAPEPFASSLAYEVYRRMPNDTDFSVLKRAGIRGLNFAFVGFHPAYHTALDTPARLSRASLQHLGGTAHGAARALADLDLRELGGGEGVWLTVPAAGLVVYSLATARALAVAALLAAAAAGIALGRRRGARVRGVLAALAAFALAPVAGVLCGALFWRLLHGYLPGLLAGPHGLPYPTLALGGALALLVLGAVVAVGRLAARATALELGAGVAAGFAALAAVLTWTVPGASYLVLWPALGASLAVLAAALGGGEPAATPRDLALLAAGALPAAVVLAPILPFALEALTLLQAPIFGLLTGLALAAALPLLGVVAAPRRGLAAGLPAALGVALLAGVATLFTYDAERPRVDHLLYALDADSGEAIWATFDERPDDWTTGALGASPAPSAPPAYLPFDELLTAPAPAVELAAPAARLVGETRTEERRRLEVEIRSPRGAPIVRVFAETSVPIRLVELDGRRLDEVEGAGGELDDVRFAYYGVPPEGIRVVFEIAGRWPLELTVADQTYGLPDLAPPGPRPPGFMAGTSRLTDSTYVSTSFLF